MEIGEDVEKIKEYRAGLLRERGNESAFDVINSFNKGLFFIINFCKKKRPTDANIYRLKDLMSTAKGINHDVLIKEAGPYLVKSFSNIVNKSDDMFTDDWMKSQLVKVKSAKNQQFALEVFMTAREIIDRDLTADEKNVIYSKIHLMLDDFLVYTYVVK